jgi:predicted DsbA family dithiol-disulfide isomerase
MDINAMTAGLNKRFVQEGLVSGNFDMIYNTRLAQELAKWAETMEPSGDIHMLLYKAYFVDNSNLSSKDVLIAVAEKAGLSGKAAEEVLEKRTMKEKIDQDWQLSGKMGVTGVPTFAAGGGTVVGFQSYEIIDRMVKQAL